MSWIPKSSNAVRLACGIALGSTVAVGAYVVKQSDSDKGSAAQAPQPVFPKPQLGKVFASWTTNFTPSEKWNDNWDRLVSYTALLAFLWGSTKLREKTFTLPWA